MNSPDAAAANLRQAISINNDSTPAQRRQAVVDNTFAVDNGSIVADGLGPMLDRVYQDAIANHSPLLGINSNIVQAFKQANAFATTDAAFSKMFFFDAARATGATSSDLRPFQTVPEKIRNFAPAITSPLTDNPAFPSGHSSFAYTQDLLFGIMVPERYRQLLTRASEYGDSRIVLGAHYPLDIIGGRIIGTYNVVQLLTNNPGYLNRTVGVFGGGNVTTASDFAALFGQATTDLRGLLREGCGADLAFCAVAGGSDRFGDAKRNRDEYAFRLTYGLPPVGPTNLPPVVPAGAEVLLRTRFPYLNPAQLREVLATTELPSGVPLDDGGGWARLNLYAAADGYGAFNKDVAVTMDAARGGFSAADTWNNNIGGAGGLTLSGTGTLVLNGSNTYSGPSVIHGGTLVVNGSIASPVFVDPGGTLRGTGIINAPVVNSGTLAPGDPGLVDQVGTLRVNGNVTQRSGAGFRAQISATGASELRVSGTAVLDGTLEIKPLDGFVPRFGQTFPVLSAGEGVRGTFAGVVAPVLPGSLFYQPLYTTDSIGIMAARPLAEFAGSANQRSIATALDQIRTTPDRELQNALSRLYPAEATGGVSRALDQLAPESAFATTLFGRLFADVLANQFTERASALRAGATGFSIAAPRLEFSRSGTDNQLGSLLQAAGGGRVDTDGDRGAPARANHRIAGFLSGQIVFGDHTFTPSQKERRFTAAGVALGLDYRIGAMSAIGIAGSYFTGNAGLTGGGTNARAGALSLYGTAQSGPVYLDGFISGGLIGSQTTRSLDFDGPAMTASGASGGRLAAFGANIGYRLERQTEAGSVSWGPVGQLRFNNVAVNDYSESGFGALSTHIRGRDSSSFQTGLGVEVSFALSTATSSFSPYIRTTWRHEFADTGDAAVANFLVAPGNPFALASSRVGRDFAVIAAGVSSRLGPGLALSADYVGDIGRRGESVHQISLNARVAF